MVRVGWGWDLLFEGAEVRAPASEEWTCEDWMCVPVPGLLAEAGPRGWPGRVRVDVDMLLYEMPSLELVDVLVGRSYGFWRNCTKVAK